MHGSDHIVDSSVVRTVFMTGNDRTQTETAKECTGTGFRVEGLRARVREIGAKPAGAVGRRWKEIGGGAGEGAEPPLPVI